MAILNSAQHTTRKPTSYHYCTTFQASDNLVTSSGFLCQAAANSQAMFVSTESPATECGNLSPTFTSKSVNIIYKDEIPTDNNIAGNGFTVDL
ncbi:hypothetical protein E2C01_068922 [Portunus trituberculatus]|uniref:Uncharacterized protein n=1 Tax=Portunus trituberculatus TaxID=210409 RepID=A0A5B7HY10_PORTR|nr:hypothetical protein [Portunus trituberculatus]